MNENQRQIPIPQELEGRVGAAMAQVRRIHRGRVLRRAGGALGALVVAAGTLFTLSYTNPALAARIPLVGDWLGSLFYQVNYDSKAGTNGAFVETYGALEELDAAAQSGQWQLGFDQGYTDGSSLVVSMELSGPEEELAQYRAVLVDFKTGLEVTVNGEEAQVEGVNAFAERDGRWATTMTVEVPQSQQEADTLQVEVSLEGLSGEIYDEAAAQQADQQQLDQLEWNANPETAEKPYPGEAAPNPVTYQEIPGSFSASFSLQVDQEHSYRFSSDAQQNGAQVLEVSGTPAQTVITVVKPFWGLLDSIVETETPTQGIAALVLPDGTEITWNVHRSQDLGGYDYQSTQTQTADLYFDGLPEGIDQVELRFYKDGQREEILAAFAINLANGTVVPAGE